MKKQIISLMLIFAAGSMAYSQQSPQTLHENTISATSDRFILRGELTAEKAAFYKASINAASMENYRLREKEVILQFEEGFECILPSAKQLIIKGHSIDPNMYLEEFPFRFVLPVFSVKPDGQLIAKYEKVFK